jgi:hypothetical protein
VVSDSGLTSPRATGLQNGVCNNDRPAFQGIETSIHRCLLFQILQVTMTGPLSRALRQRNIVNDDFVCIVTMTPPNLPAHFITQREIAEATPVEYLQKHGF